MHDFNQNLQKFNSEGEQVSGATAQADQDTEAGGVGMGGQPAAQTQGAAGALRRPACPILGHVCCRFWVSFLTSGN